MEDDKDLDLVALVDSVEHLFAKNVRKWFSARVEESIRWAARTLLESYDSWDEPVSTKHLYLLAAMNLGIRWDPSRMNHVELSRGDIEKFLRFRWMKPLDEVTDMAYGGLGPEQVTDKET